MNPENKRSKAKTILAEIDALFHMAEQATPNKNVTYLDVVRISDRVREHFENKAPPQIEAALSIATGFCHPNKLEGIASIKKGFAALLMLTGGGALLWGIVYIIAIGLTATTVTGMLWWKTTTITILFGGPVGIAIGIASLAVGIYTLSLKTPSKKRAIMALDVIKKGIENWVASDSQRVLPDITWITKLSEDEFFALVSIAWHIVNADNEQTQEEMFIIDQILCIRKLTEKAVANGLGNTPLNEAIETLRKSKYADKCFSLLKIIPEVDGVVSPEEAEILGLFEI